MLVQDFIQISRPYEDVRADILLDAHLLIDAHAADGYRDGELLCLRLQALPKHPRLRKKIVVDIGEPYSRGDGLLLPIHLWAKGATHLFPRLDGDLEVMPMGDDLTQLMFSGRYDPPLGGLGRNLDRMLLHRVTETSMRSFLQRLGESLSQPSILESSYETTGGRS